MSAAKEGEVHTKRLKVTEVPEPDPFTQLIEDGRVRNRPIRYHSQCTVLTIDLDILATHLIDRITPFYSYGTLFSGRNADAEIKTAVTNMVNVAMMITYNRLRAVALQYSSQVFSNQMLKRAPIDNSIEFPEFLASTLGSIGPLFVNDAPCDSLIIYATSASKMESYGRSRSVLPELNMGSFYWLTEELRHKNVRMAPINVGNVMTGSFFTTIEPRIVEGFWVFDGMLSPTHYENEDIMRAYLCLHPDSQPMVDQVSMTIEFCTDKAVVEAVRAARPEGVDAAVNGDDDRLFHQHVCFPVNLFGIGRAENGGKKEVEGVYIIGRGNHKYYASQLAQGICEYELNASLRYRLMSTS